MFFVAQFILNWIMLTTYFVILDTFVQMNSDIEFFMKIISGIILIFIMSPYINEYARTISGDTDD